jgi:transposase
MCALVARVAALIRIDAIWLATEPVDMRAGADTLLARVVKVFGAARPHHAYLFANQPSTRMKVLVYDGFGIWLAARRLNKGRFIWTNGEQAVAVSLNPEQLRALVTGLPWRTLAHDHAITVV